MRRLAALALAWMLALCGPALAHEVTFSHVELRLEPGVTRVSVTLPKAALQHETPPPQPAALVAARLRLSAGGAALPLTLQSVRPAGDDVALIATAPPAAGLLSVEANLFPADTLAKVFVTVFRGQTLAGQYALDRQNPTFRLPAQQPLSEVIAAFIGQGVRHIFIGPDHILFVLALVLLGGAVTRQIKIITAFTVAHSITLVLATLNIVQPPARLVESVIAFSIVVVGLHNLWRLHRPVEAGADAGKDPRAVLAFGFGLVHGFGFASVLAQLDLPRQALTWSLAAFNIGVEIGQVCIILAAAPLLWALSRYAPPQVAKGVLTAAASGVVFVGVIWLWQRALVS